MGSVDAIGLKGSDFFRPSRISLGRPIAVVTTSSLTFCRSAPPSEIDTKGSVRMARSQWACQHVSMSAKVHVSKGAANQFKLRGVCAWESSNGNVWTSRPAVGAWRTGVRDRMKLDFRSATHLMDA
eukprot:1159268-Pelagomonas_calceolata.AAC.3